MNSNNLKEIFENIQDGTVLAFYRSGLIGSIIPFFTREKKENKPRTMLQLFMKLRKVYRFMAGVLFALSSCQNRAFTAGNIAPLKSSNMVIFFLQPTNIF